MNLREIGQLVYERRTALELSQAQLARLANLSRATINQLENGTLIDLGIAKLTRLLDLLGLQIHTSQHRQFRGLVMATRSASVSYKTSLKPKQLAMALASGELPLAFTPHVATFLDEAPLAVVVAAVEESAKLQGIPVKKVWKHLSRWAKTLKSPRLVWA
jgi:transcriptional regulator with XRE-family HTH domain